MTVDYLSERLAQYRPSCIDHATVRRAAVSIILHEGPETTDFLVIHRSERAGDPWSGQIGLPGGREQPGDRNLLCTAIRETREEVGVDLDAIGRSIGKLDDLQAMARGRVMDLVITPFVHALHGPRPELQIEPNEVQSAFWVPLAGLAETSSRATLRHEIPGGPTLEFPAFAYRGHMIWGLTYRILSQLMTIVAPAGDESR